MPKSRRYPPPPYSSPHVYCHCLIWNRPPASARTPSNQTHLFPTSPNSPARRVRAFASACKPKRLEERGNTETDGVAQRGNNLNRGIELLGTTYVHCSCVLRHVPLEEAGESSNQRRATKSQTSVPGTNSECYGRCANDITVLLACLGLKQEYAPTRQARKAKASIALALEPLGKRDRWGGALHPVGTLRHAMPAVGRRHAPHSSWTCSNSIPARPVPRLLRRRRCRCQHGWLRCLRHRS
jgi:hypothetical protein